MNKFINSQFARDVKDYNSVTEEFSVTVANGKIYCVKILENEIAEKIGEK